MTNCRQCGAPVPPSIGRTGGRAKAFCAPACRIAWTKRDQAAKRAARGPDTADRPAYSHSSEIAGRRAEIDRTPALRAQLDRLRAPRPRVPVHELLRRLELDGLREKTKKESQA